VRHAYLPLDAPGAVGRFLKRVQPACGLVLETEIWPNLFAGCAARGIPLAVVNGRLSPKTLAAPAWLRRAFGRALAAVSLCLARSAADAERFRALGVPEGVVRVAGNLKYARHLPSEGQGVAALPHRPFVLAASTREGEEALVAEAWRQARPSGRLLVIAPRHPERREAIRRELADRGLAVAVRSRGDPVTADTGIYLADTLGELGGFMAGAEVVFMGGSLVPKGGHNLLEPAALGRAIVTGPHTENFAEEAAALREAGGLVEVADATELGEALSALLADADRRHQLGEAARRTVAEQAGVLETYVEALSAWCPALRGAD
jgi:3-deoxy-D-manno-octulosonic-acid transferase